eukprot:5617561-Alexandrium_andersonii.AAC.1
MALCVRLCSSFQLLLLAHRARPSLQAAAPHPVDPQPVVTPPLSALVRAAAAADVPAVAPTTCFGGW